MLQTGGIEKLAAEDTKRQIAFRFSERCREKLIGPF
jgi:hypothetical protein